MDNRYYFDLSISAYNNIKRLIWDMMTNNDSRVPDGYTRDDITHLIIDDVLEPDLKDMLENKKFDPSENYERHYKYLAKDISVSNIRGKLNEYDMLRMTPLTSRATHIKKLVRELKGLSYHIHDTPDARDDFNSLRTILCILEETINDDLTEIKSNVEHTQKDGLRPRHPYF